jgi:hypothetical protein
MQLFFNAIASRLQARQTCIERGTNDWSDRHRDCIEDWVKEHAPSGSGFDRGTTLDFEASRPERLVFNTAFHHMDQHGGYDGWTEHTVIVQQSLLGLDVRVTGLNRNDVKTYISETFHHLQNIDIDAKERAHG